MFEKENDNEFFVSAHHRNNVENLIPSFEVMINYRDNGFRAKKACFFHAERMDLKSVIQLRITEKCDNRSMYITTVDSTSFLELKQDQSLHVPFEGFVENLAQMLKECQVGKLEFSIVRHDNCLRNNNTSAGSSEFQLQFIEPRSFKNIVHLSLPCRKASLNVVLFYISNLLEVEQRKNSASEQARKHLEIELDGRQQNFQQLEEEMSKLREKFAENTKTLNEHHASQMQQLQLELRKLNEYRNEDAERHNKIVANLQGQLEKLNAENAQLLAERERESNRVDGLREELTTANSRICLLKENNDKLNSEMLSMKSNEHKQNSLLNDLKQQISEFHDAIRKANKEKANIAAELEAEKKILHTKRQALEIATEEISKANQIIFKQNQEIAKQKKTIDLRTEVSLEQEKTLREKEQLLSIYKQEISKKDELVEALQKDVPQQLDSIRKFAKHLEEKYTNQIATLQLKLRILEN